MGIHLTPAQESKLNDLALASSRGTDELIQEAVDNLLAYNKWFKEQVQIGMEELKRSEGVEHEEVR